MRTRCVSRVPPPLRGSSSTMLISHLNGPCVYSRNTPMRLDSIHSNGCSCQLAVTPDRLKVPKRLTSPCSLALAVNCTADNPAARLSRSVLDTCGHRSCGEDSRFQDQS